MLRTIFKRQDVQHTTNDLIIIIVSLFFTSAYVEHMSEWNAAFKVLLSSGSFPGPLSSSAGYGPPPQTQYPGMDQQAPPPSKQLTNQMGAMNLGNYGTFTKKTHVV